MEVVKIKNIVRRPLIFRVPGKSFRIGFGESVDIPKTFLDTSELKKLRREGLILVIKKRKPQGKKAKVEKKKIKKKELKKFPLENKADAGSNKIK